MNELYVSVTGCTNVLSATVNTSHGTAISMATVETKSTTLELGDLVSIDMGYTNNHAVLFTGYVKQIDQTVLSDTYNITLYDVLTRAQDFFIASSSPASPLKYKNITAEALVQDLMAKAGLTSWSGPTSPTLFTFGIANDFEVNLIASMDYARMVCDLLTYSFWATSNGTVSMKNRKPFYVSADMASAFSQPGLSGDTPTSYVLTDELVTNITYMIDEKNLRNRVVVYGTGDAHGEASEASDYLPPDFYKTALLAAPGLLDDNTICNSVAAYNLKLLNKITEKVSAIAIGDPTLEARTVIRVNSDSVGLTATDPPDYFYIYTCAHTLDSSGYMTQLELVR